MQTKEIPRDEILILVATGLHRPNQGNELEEMVGPDIVKHYRTPGDFPHLDLHTTANGYFIYGGGRP